MPISLRARVVYPVDRPPIVGGVVTIEGDRIVDVGEATADVKTTDLGSVALLPGPVNAHTHLEFSHLRKPLGRPGMSLVEWIRLIIAERGRSETAAGNDVAKGLQESIAHGVTTIGDIATGAVTPSPGEAKCVSFFEVIGFSHARAESTAAAVIDKLDHPANVGRRIGISPHAPYTVSPDLLQRLVAASQRRNLPVAMHLAESREELELLSCGTGPFQELLDERSMWDAGAIAPGTRTLDYLQQLAEAPRALVIHGNYLHEDELAFVAKYRQTMSLVYCPRTHAYFRHSPYPLKQALASRVRVALGTDSRASNPDLNLFAEMQYAMNAHAGIAPAEILRMGTLAGAEALGLDDEVGSLTSGKLANFIAIPISGSANDSFDDLLGALLAAGTSPCGVWYHGKRIESTQA